MYYLSEIGKIKNIFPLIGDLKSYSLPLFKGDLVAGITVGVILIPQAIAYAQLAGMPAVYGFYAGLIPLLIYGLMGTSRQLSVGPVAISSILIFAGVSVIADPYTERYISLVLLLGFCVGLVQFLMGVFRFGFLANFLSRPVLSGFMSAAALVIIVSQVATILGLSEYRSTNTITTLWETLTHISETQIVPLLMSSLGLIFILIMKRIFKPFPSALVLVMIGAAMTYFFSDIFSDVVVVGEIKSGLPSIINPISNISDIRLLIPVIVTVSLIGCVETLTIAKTLDIKHQHYDINTDQELRAVGLSKFFGAFFQALPSSASFSRSAINDDSGAMTGLSSLFAAGLMVISLLFLAPLFFFIPKAILSAIIVASVLKLIDINYARKLWKISRNDFVLMLLTFGVTIFVGIESGVLTGVLLSFGMMLFRSSRPLIMELGRVPKTDTYRNLDRFSTAHASSQYIVIRFDSRLYFANSDYFLEQTLLKLGNRTTKPNYLILDSSNINSIDMTGLHALEALCDHLNKIGIVLLVSGAKGVLRDFFKLSGFYEKSNPRHHFMNISNAVKFIHSEDYDWNDGAIQSNHNRT